jgi:hypothetical protein
MKWQSGLIPLCILMVCLLLWQNSTKNQLINQLQMKSLEKQVDTFKLITTKSVVEYKDRIKTNTKIVDRWNKEYIVDSFTSIDTLFLQAKTDINYLDTSLRKCDTALSNCLRLSNAQSDYINALLSKKTPLVIPYVGIGLSIDKNETVSPSIQAGIGFNLNKIFRSKK